MSFIQKAAKYDEGLASEAAGWISAIQGTTPANSSPDAIQEWLKDGKVLCNLINALQPGSVPKINESKMAFKMVCALQHS